MYNYLFLYFYLKDYIKDFELSYIIKNLWTFCVINYDHLLKRKLTMPKYN